MAKNEGDKTNAHVAVEPREQAAQAQKASLARSEARHPSSAEVRWTEQALKPALDRSPERASSFTTLSGVPIDRLYTRADLADFDYTRHLGDPGEYPFTRGIHRT